MKLMRIVHLTLPRPGKSQKVICEILSSIATDQVGFFFGTCNFFLRIIQLLLFFKTFFGLPHPFGYIQHFLETS